MDPTRDPAPRAAAGEAVPAQLAKAALRRLVLDKLEPTPENYTRAYVEEAGGTASPALPTASLPVVERLVARALSHVGPALQRDLQDALAKGQWAQADQILERQKLPDSGAQAAALAGLIERIVRGVERGGRQWTSARKKDSLQRVLSSTRSDVSKLHQRLGQLVGGWETDTLDETVETEEGEALDTPAQGTRDAEAPQPDTAVLPAMGELGVPSEWPSVLDSLGGVVQKALPPPPAPSATLAEELGSITDGIKAQGPTTDEAQRIAQLCKRAGRVLEHRHHLIDQLGGLCHELTASLTDLAEDDSWARGQCDAMRLQIEDGLTARSVRSVSELLQSTRERQGHLREERTKARDALKSMIQRMLSELGELGVQTGRFHDSIGRYAGVIEKADSLESLAGAVREMVEESRTVEALVNQAQNRLQTEHQRATGLSDRVVELESELRRLSEEVSTDQLTQIANRRGLIQAFDTERAKLERSGGELCVGLLDIDNFKRLNDELGHGVGDEALKALAATVSKALRPTDLVARYGGEEFVVLLPDTPLAEGEQILTRLQRSLTGGLFMHEQRQIFVTFSAGVTAYQLGERIETALERADEALYEAKRTGKNRTCLG